MQVKDKVVVVTGAASGIGKALCQRFAAEGARAIVASDVNKEGTEQVAAEIAGQTESLAVVTDVGNEETPGPAGWWTFPVSWIREFIASKSRR